MLDRDMWEPMLEKLQIRLDTFPYCAERELMRFYLEELRYRCWHNTKGILPKWCYATDLDFLEWTSCYGKIELRGIIEIKTKKSTPWNRKKQWQLDIYSQLGQKLGIPIYLVEFGEQFSQFNLNQLYPKEHQQKMSQEEFVKFLIKLHQC